MALYISVPYRGVAPESIHAGAMLVAIRIRLLSGRLRPAGSVGDLKQVVVRDIYNRFGSRLSCKKNVCTSMSIAGAIIQHVYTSQIINKNKFSMLLLLNVHWQLAS